jgi:radical SAM superfamily enzyme YgiQ (UPF0313 family)
MKLWLVVPPRPREQVLNLIPPYALGYLAAACLRAGHTPVIVDAPMECLSVDDLVRRAEAERPEVVGLSLFSTDVASAARVCRALKQLPHPPVTILGGIHASSFPEATLSAIPEADYLFVGEAETGLSKLLDALAADTQPAKKRLTTIPGLGWRDGRTLRLNPKAEQKDLDALGMPAWSLLNPLKYQRYPPTLFVHQRPFAPIITSRGCPHVCTFCAGHQVSGRKIRTRSLDAIFAEIAELRQRYGIRELHIEDDNFTHSRARVVEFCKRLIRLDWRLTWTMPNGVRLDTLDAELLALMKRAGCYLLILGVESGSGRILAHMRKKITLAQVEEKTALVAQAGILPHAFFMLGYPGETESDLQATLKLALRLPLIGAHFSSYRPLPSTQSADELIARGEIQPFEFSATQEQGTFATVVYAPKGMTRARVKQWQRTMLLRFYLRPGIAWVYFRETLAHPGLIINLFRRAWRYLAENG